MGKFIDITGNRYGRLIVIHRSDEKKEKRIRWKCKCDCGKYKIVVGEKLKKGHTKSCGCLRKEQLVKRNKKHGLRKSLAYVSWHNMKSRCYNPNVPSYKYYGGRGITVCGEWIDSFENFYKDMGERPSLEFSLERLDNDEGYSKSNCCWGTRKQQARNQRVRKTNRTEVRGSLV